MLWTPLLLSTLLFLHWLPLDLNALLPDQPLLEIHLIGPLLILFILPQKHQQFVLVMQELLDLAEVEHGLQVHV